MKVTMKKLALAFLTVIALGGSFNTQCFSLWPFNAEDTKTYDITELKNYITESKVQICFNHEKDTIFMKCQGIGPFSGDRLYWFKSLPYVIKVDVLAVTSDFPPNVIPLIPWITYHIKVTLKPSAYQELTSWWMNAHTPKQTPLELIVNQYIFGKKSTITQ